MIALAGNNVRPVKNVFEEFLKLEGELTDDQARATLAEFMFHNPAFTWQILGRMHLLPMQEMMIKLWCRNDYNLAVWGRGVSKSWTVAFFILFWAIFNPGTRIVVVSASFRQSRAILETCEKFINDKQAVLLRGCFPDKIERKTDEWKLKCPNGSTIRCLPLGDGSTLRGIRSDVLVADEFGFMPESIIAEVLRPFLASKGKVREQLAIREKEDDLIEKGLMTEADRTVLDDRKKVIFLSSATYSFEHLAVRFRDWVHLLNLNPDTEKQQYQEYKASGRSYSITRLSWEAAPKEILDIDEINQAKREISESMFNKEYGAQFISDSDGYFRAVKMQECTIPDGESPCLELVGDPNAEYVIGIDQSLSGAETSDHFAMCVMKIVKRETDGKQIGMVVHSYAVAGGGLKDHMIYLYYLVTNFNVVYIALDASQGDEVEFVNSCNQNSMFQSKGIQLLSIEGADFKKHDFQNMPTEIRRGYNKAAGKIVQKQPFNSEFQRAANEYLQACYDHRNIRFAAKIAANGTAATRALNIDISGLRGHKEFGEMTVSEFIDHQDYLVDLTKKECAMIQVKVTDLGTMSFGLAQNLKRTTGVNRVRKDSYSALLVANWGVKMYTSAMALDVQTGPQEFPYMMIG